MLVDEREQRRHEDDRLGLKWRTVFQFSLFVERGSKGIDENNNILIIV